MKEGLEVLDETKRARMREEANIYKPQVVVLCQNPFFSGVIVYASGIQHTCVSGYPKWAMCVCLKRDEKGVGSTTL